MGWKMLSTLSTESPIKYFSGSSQASHPGFCTKARMLFSFKKKSRQSCRPSKMLSCSRLFSLYPFKP